LVEWLIVFRRAPFGWVNVVEALRLSSAVASEHALQILFIDDGVYCLMKGQAPKAIAYPAIDNFLKMLKELNVRYYVVQESLDERGLKRDDIEPAYQIEITPMDNVAEIITQNKVVVSF
jgi:sulfur relay protein TusC/DsrF